MIVVRTLSEPPMPYDGVFTIEDNTWYMYRNILRTQTCDGYIMSDFFNASQVIDENPTDAITNFVLKLGYNKPLVLVEKCYQQYLEYIEFVDKNMSVIFPGMFTESVFDSEKPEPLEPELQEAKEYARMLATETDEQRDARRKKELAALLAKAKKALLAEQKREATLAAKKSEWTTVGKK